MPDLDTNRVTLTVSDDTWQPHDAACTNARSRLWALLTINGVLFHLDAFEVDGAGQPTATWQEDVDTVLCGHGSFGTVETVPIAGRNYLLFAHPFA